MDIINEPKTEEKTQEQLQSELKDARIKELEESLAKARKSDREWQEVFDLALQQKLEERLQEARAKDQAEANALAAAAEIDRKPFVPARPSDYESYLNTPTKVRAEIIRLYGAAYIEKLGAEYLTKKRRQRDLSGKK